MQHPGGTCVALPNVDACPQLSCAALTFMYLQQVSSYYRKDTNLYLVHLVFVSSRGSGLELENCMLLYSQGRMGMSGKHCVQFVAV